MNATNDGEGRLDAGSPEMPFQRAADLLRAVADGLGTTEKRPVRPARNVAAGPREPDGERARASDG